MTSKTVSCEFRRGSLLLWITATGWTETGPFIIFGTWILSGMYLVRILRSTDFMWMTQKDALIRTLDIERGFWCSKVEAVQYYGLVNFNVYLKYKTRFKIKTIFICATVPINISLASTEFIHKVILQLWTSAIHLRHQIRATNQFGGQKIMRIKHFDILFRISALILR